MHSMNGSDFPPVTEETFCKYVLYYEINNSRVRIWDLIILIPNALFVLFLVVRFNKAQLKLRATSSPIFLTFYSLVWWNVIVSLVRCAVSMTVNAATTEGSLVDKILWVTVNFFLLATEMSVVIFGLAFGHMDSRSSIKYVLLATSLISFAFSVTQGTLEVWTPNEMFHIDTRDYDLFGHGGLMFWFVSSLVFAIIYFIILLLPWVPLREYLALPSKISFYLYILLLALLDSTQAVGAGLVAWGPADPGLCVLDVTTWIYFSLYTPLVYHTFLSEFFSVSQPSIMFSYKAQMDEPIDDDQVSLPHQQSFSSLKTDSDYIYQSNSVYDSTLFEAGGTTPMNPVYSASLQSPDSIASGNSIDMGHTFTQNMMST
ncbi:transmembrane protein adipocyte-associated 1 homolog isoform X2 [Aricia agestis]|uniref:transmembrane protein adipocyte-associated 1 homolog isoform X2 n=1 Tax=Aricia agestis TaxID=91739 RepID=UPI001C2075CD|nr:transmembrane protein adipocyte-associated 1 homolog isoform X2 [Aricia agestis]